MPFLLKIIYSSKKCHIYPHKFMPFESRLILEVSHYIKEAYSILIICSNGIMKNGSSYFASWSIPSKFLDLFNENYLFYQKKSYLLPPIHPISIKNTFCKFVDIWKGPILIVCSNRVLTYGANYFVSWSIPSKFLDLFIENHLFVQKKAHLVPPIHANWF